MGDITRLQDITKYLLSGTHEFNKFISNETNTGLEKSPKKWKEKIGKVPEKKDWKIVLFSLMFHHCRCSRCRSLLMSSVQWTWWETNPTWTSLEGRWGPTKDKLEPHLSRRVCCSSFSLSDFLVPSVNLTMMAESISLLMYRSAFISVDFLFQSYQQEPLSAERLSSTCGWIWKLRGGPWKNPVCSWISALCEFTSLWKRPCYRPALHYEDLSHYLLSIFCPWVKLCVLLRLEILGWHLSLQSFYLKIWACFQRIS